MVASHRFVGHSDNGYDVMVVLNELAQGFYGKLGGAHEDDFHL